MPVTQAANLEAGNLEVGRMRTFKESLGASFPSKNHEWGIFHELHSKGWLKSI